MDLYSKKTLEHFRGKAVRKDLTNMMKRGVNVPGYVLEYLLGMYCATDNQDVINTGIKKITNILTSNYVRHDELEKVKFILSQKGEYTIIDKIVGRVAAIINRRANESWNEKKVRFGFFDFIEDINVCKKLIEKTILKIRFLT